MVDEKAAQQAFVEALLQWDYDAMFTKFQSNQGVVDNLPTLGLSFASIDVCILSLHTYLLAYRGPRRLRQAHEHTGAGGQMTNFAAGATVQASVPGHNSQGCGAGVQDSV